MNCKDINLDLYLTSEEQNYYRDYLWFMTQNNYFDLLYYLKNKNRFFIYNEL